MRVRCYIDKRVHLIWVARSLAGIYAQPDCNVSLEVVDWIQDDQCIGVEIDGARLAIEHHDHANKWNQPLLDWCDLYAKRNIHPKHVSPQQHKIVPLGIHLAAHSHRSAIAVLAATARAYPRGFRPRPVDIYRYLVSPLWQHFEYRPDQPVEDTVLYQTRVWPPDESPEDYTINDERVALLRALRAEFGPRFRGGLVPTPYAHQHYPDLITSNPTRQPQYIAWSKKPAIGVFSRGLFGAVAIKMSELLAASKAIVSQPIEMILPQPLRSPLFFNSADDCVAACQQLFCDPALLRELRHASWEYYNQVVQTPTALRRVLLLALERKGSGAAPTS